MTLHVPTLMLALLTGFLLLALELGISHKRLRAHPELRARRPAHDMSIVDPKGAPVFARLSAGFAAAFANDDDLAERLYGRADRALHTAKCSERNRVERYVSDDTSTMLPLG